MKKLLLFFTALLCFGKIAHAVQVTIGTGTLTSTTFGPIYASSATSTFFYSKHVYIYSEAELTAAGLLPGATLNSVAWDKAGTGTNTSQFKVYMQSGNPNPSGATWSDFQTGSTTVYDNAALALPATTGWQTVTLSSAYTYRGGSLIVMTEAFWSANSAALTWRYGALTAVQTGYWNGSTDNINPTLSGTVNRPNIQLDYTAAAACSGTPTAGTIPSNLQACGPISSLYSSGVSRNPGVTYQWEQSTNGTTWTNVVGGLGGTTPFYSTPSVSVATQYRLKATCTNGAQSATTNAVTIQPISKFASVPYSTSFGANWVTRCAPAPFAGETPDSFWITTPTFGNTSWRRNNTPITQSGWTGTTGAYPNRNATDTLSARFHSYNAAVGAAGAMDLYINLSTVAGAKALTFEHINPTGEAVADSLYVQLSEDGGATFTTLAVYGTAASWTLRAVNINSTAARAVIRLLAVSDFGDDDIGVDNLSIAGACSARPTAGTVSGPASTCPGYSVTVSTTGTTTGGALTYQWQKSADGTTWTNIAGANSLSVTEILSATTRYRLIANCTAVSQSDTSTAFTVTAVATTYGMVPFSENFSTWLTKCATGAFTRDVPSTSWVGSPASGNNSWRQNNTVTTTSGWGSLTGAYPNRTATDTVSARFHSYNAPTNATGSLDLYMNLSSPAGQKVLIFDYINLTGTDSLFVQISENGGTTFTTLASFATAATWTNQTVNLSSNATQAIIRFLAKSDFGNDDIGVDNLMIAGACTGRPSAGTITAPTTVCPGSIVALTATGATAGGTIAYQWQSSPDGTTWTNIGNATTSSLNPTITSAIRYRFVVSCGSSSQADTSAASAIAITATPYATVPVFENFESWLTKCAPDTLKFDAPTSSWVGSPGRGNNAWRRNDQGINGGWTALTSYAYTPTASSGSYSARFHAGSATRGLVGTLDLYVNLSAAGQKQIAFDHINTSGTDTLRILLSNDGGLTFRQVDTTIRTSATWSRKSLITNSTSATAIVRFEATSDFGTTDIGLDNLSITTACSGAPTAGTVVTSTPSVCPGNSVTIVATGNSIGFGLTQQWQSSPNGTTWTNIANETGSSITVVPLSTTQYRLVTTCTNGSTSVNTQALTIAVTAPTVATIPYVQNFSTWATRCATAAATNDSPAPEWNVNPTAGNNAWRRNNDGVSAAWGNALGSYVNRLATDTLSARFHSYGAASRSVGTMDLYVNLNGIAGAKDVSFYHINATGTDSLRVLLSTDNGATFTQVGATLRSPIAAWSRRSFTILSNATNAIVRLEATSDFGTTDIGVDSLTILKGCNPATISPAGAVAICAGDSLRLTSGGFGTYLWSTGATTASIFAKTAGKYYVTATDGACVATDSITLSVNPKPIPNYTSVAAGGVVTFTNTSTGGSTYRWTFGDVANSTSTALSPSFTYTANGNYTVKLVVTTAAGCRDSVTKTVAITRVGTTELGDKLTVKVFPNPVQSVLSVQFTDGRGVLKPTDRLIITNAIGQIVADMPISSQNMDINTTQWATGLYFLTARLNGVSMRIEQVIKFD